MIECHLAGTLQRVVEEDKPTIIVKMIGTQRLVHQYNYLIVVIVAESHREGSSGGGDDHTCQSLDDFADVLSENSSLSSLSSL
jgi:hypothetical protein